MAETASSEKQTLFSPYKMGKFNLSHRLVIVNIDPSTTYVNFGDENLLKIFNFFLNFVKGGIGANDEV